MREEDEMDMLEIAIQKDLERFYIIPEQTGADDLLIDIYATMFEYMKELRKRIRLKGSNAVAEQVDANTNP